MLSSIHPFGERARGQSYPLTVVFFVVGATVGGLTLGMVVALAAGVVDVTLGGSATAAALVLLAAGAWDLAGLPVWSLHRQVNQNWLPRYRGWAYGTGFGLQLGLGFVTYAASALTYGFVFSAIALGFPLVGLVSGGVFGLTRGLSVMATASVDTPDRLKVLFERLHRSAGTVKLASAVVVLAAAIVVVV